MGVYHANSDSLDLPQFTLTLPKSHVQASGTLSSTSSVRLSATTSSLVDWLPFIAAIRGPALLPVVLNGSATFNGSMTGSGNIVEVQATAERDPFTREQLDELIDLAAGGIVEISEYQLEAAAAPLA